MNDSQKAVKANRSLVLCLTDLAIVILSYAFSLGLAAVAGMFPDRIYVAVLWIAVPAAVYTVFFMILHINRMIWRYASGNEYLRLLAVSVICGLASFLFFELLTLQNALPVLYSIISASVCAVVILLSRLCYYALVNTSSVKSAGSAPKRLLIVGAGTAGSLMLSEIKHNPALGLLPVALIDDDRAKQHRRLYGVRIFGGVDDIESVCSQQNVSVIYVAIPSATNRQRARILNECAKTGCSVKILPFFSEIAGSDSIADKVRSITPEELLGREPIEVASESLLSFICGKTIAITGGGGSIGSELCRQIAAHSPRRLIIIDIYENNAYAIQQELIGKYGDALNLEVYIASVREFSKINRIFSLERPDIVIHAAAHKHVPLMEASPDEAVKNNVFGLLNTATAASKNRVPKFILISTDKAVNPTNVMGATKRICEMIIQHFSETSETNFASVRFGNVLGSNGSVIPLFKKQIEARADVTVTHSEMIRYFMTIPEASQLVLAAGAMANGGEIFVLDMGAPVRIYDLAKKMISLSGLTLGRDINIRYIGLRPGEKMYEELLMSEEGLSKTLNDKIFIGKPIVIDSKTFLSQLEALRRLVDNPESSHDEIRRLLAEIVPTFHPEGQPSVPAESVRCPG